MCTEDEPRQGRRPPSRTTEAAAAVAELLKVRPGFTMQQLAQDGAKYSDNPTFRKEFERIAEGARKAGLPER